MPAFVAGFFHRFVGTMRRLAALFLGTALALPMYSQSIPWQLELVQGIAPFIFLIALLAAYQQFRDGALRVDALTLALGLSVLSLFYGLPLTPEESRGSVTLEILRGLYFVILAYGVAHFGMQRDGALWLRRSFLFSAALFAVALAILGTIKYLLFLVPEFISQILTEPLSSYPWGSALTQEYNFYALSLLIGAFALCVFWTEAKHDWSALFFAICLVFVVIVAAYAGSRRFWLLAPAMLGSQLMLYFSRRYVALFSARTLALLLAAALGVGAAVWERHNEDTLRAYVRDFTDRLPLAALILNGIKAHGVPGFGAIDYEYRLLSMTDPAEEFGMSARKERWAFAVQLGVNSPIAGMGFDYRDSFSCRFQACEADDNPHNPILSAWLYGGLFGVFTVSLLMWISLRNAIGFARAVPLEGTGIALGYASTLVFAMISGDTIFSMPVLITTAIAASIYPWSNREVWRVPVPKFGQKKRL